MLTLGFWLLVICGAIKFYCRRPIIFIFFFSLLANKYLIARILFLLFIGVKIFVKVFVKHKLDIISVAYLALILPAVYFSVKLSPILFVITSRMYEKIPFIREYREQNAPPAQKAIDEEIKKALMPRPGAALIRSAGLFHTRNGILQRQS